jgi:hypothetical protein
MSDDDMLIHADSLLSLIYYRESTGLTERTRSDVGEFLPELRTRTNQIIKARREGGA